MLLSKLIKPSPGYVLIRVDSDDHLDTSVGIEVPRFWIEEQEYEKPTTGLVVGVCGSLPYHGHNLSVDDPSVQRKSMQFDVPIEVAVGDTVLFEWQALQAEWAWVSDDLLLVRYDQLIMRTGVIPYPLNGRVLLEMDDKLQNGPLVENTWNLGVEMTTAVAVLAGCLVNSYLYWPNESDKEMDFNGKRVILSRNAAIRSQMDEYKTYGEKYPWYYCSRRDILGYFSV